MAVASLVLGIVALVFSCIPFVSWLGCICGIVGIILGALGHKREPEKKGMAIAGLVMSIIAVVLGFLVLIACAACVSLFQTQVQDALGDAKDAMGETINWEDFFSAISTGG